MFLEVYTSTSLCLQIVPVKTIYFEMQPPADFALSISRIIATRTRTVQPSKPKNGGRIHLEILYGARQPPVTKIGLFPGFLMMWRVCKNFKIFKDISKVLHTSKIIGMLHVTWCSQTDLNQKVGCECSVLIF
jgi:hypothetical protein